MILGAFYFASIILTCCGNLTNKTNDNSNITDNTNPLLIEARGKVDINKSEEFYYRKASEYLRNEGEGSWNAVANFEKAIEINSSKSGYYNDLANCYRGGIKDFNKALEYYNKAIEKGFNEGFVFYNRSICKLELSDLSGACSDYKTAINKGWNNDYYNIENKAKCTNESISKVEISGVYSGNDNVGMESTIILRGDGSMIIQASVGDGTLDYGNWTGSADNLSLYHKDAFGNDELIGNAKVTAEGLRIIGGMFYSRK